MHPSKCMSLHLGCAFVHRGPFPRFNMRAPSATSASSHSLWGTLRPCLNQFHLVERIAAEPGGQFSCNISQAFTGLDIPCQSQSKAWPVQDHLRFTSRPFLLQQFSLAVFFFFMLEKGSPLIWIIVPPFLSLRAYAAVLSRIFLALEILDLPFACGGDRKTNLSTLLVWTHDAFTRRG